MQNAPVIRRREAVVYELIKEGVRPQVIATQHGEPSIYRILRQLEQKKLVTRGTRGVYRPLVSQYQIMEEPVSVESIGPRKELTPIEPYPHITLTGSEKAYLIENRQRNRSEIAKYLKKPRYVICRELMSMGIADC